MYRNAKRFSFGQRLGALSYLPCLTYIYLFQRWSATWNTFLSARSNVYLPVSALVIDLEHFPICPVYNVHLPVSALDSDSCCAWPERCCGGPRSLCWMKPQRPWTSRLILSSRRQSGNSSQTAPY